MKLNPYAYSERGTVIFTEETEPLPIQGKNEPSGKAIW